MANIDYKWTFELIECSTAVEPPDCAKIVHWRLNGIDEDGVAASIYGTCTLGEPDPENYIAFDELTKAQVQAWVVAGIPEGQGEDDLKANVAGQIEAQKNPPLINKWPLGWNS
tara:strand:+ start:41 stop:379 length:339 start_codon:yes stop_codon:yes gene_type:complete